MGVGKKITEKTIDKLWGIRRNGYFVDWDRIKDDI